MKYGIKALMAAGVLVFAVGVQGALAAPASGKAAVNKENVQASSSAKAAGSRWAASPPRATTTSSSRSA